MFLLTREASVTRDYRNSVFSLILVLKYKKTYVANNYLYFIYCDAEKKNFYPLLYQFWFIYSNISSYITFHMVSSHEKISFTHLLMWLSVEFKHLRDNFHTQQIPPKEAAYFLCLCFESLSSVFCSWAIIEYSSSKVLPLDGSFVCFSFCCLFLDTGHMKIMCRFDY